MSNLFGFPSGLSGGSKETEYTTNYDTSRTTNYNTDWDTDRSTDKNTAKDTNHVTTGVNTYWSTGYSELTGAQYTGPWYHGTMEKWLVCTVAESVIQCNVPSYKTSLGGTNGYWLGWSGFLIPAYATNWRSSPHIAGSDTPYGSGLPGGWGGTSSSGDLNTAKSALQTALGYVKSSTHSTAHTNYSSGDAALWNSFPIHGHFGEDSYLLAVDHTGTHNGFYKVFPYIKLDWSRFYHDANYSYKIGLSEWGFYYWTESSGNRQTSKTTNKYTLRSTTAPTSYTTTFQTTQGTDKTTTFNTHHTTSHITYG